MSKSKKEVICEKLSVENPGMADFWAAVAKDDKIVEVDQGVSWLIIRLTRLLAEAAVVASAAHATMGEGFPPTRMSMAESLVLDAIRTLQSGLTPSAQIQLVEASFPEFD